MTRQHRRRRDFTPVPDHWTDDQIEHYIVHELHRVGCTCDGNVQWRVHHRRLQIRHQPGCEANG